MQEVWTKLKRLIQKDYKIQPSKVHNIFKDFKITIIDYQVVY